MKDNYHYIEEMRTAARRIRHLYDPPAKSTSADYNKFCNDFFRLCLNEKLPYVWDNSNISSKLSLYLEYWNGDDRYSFNGIDLSFVQMDLRNLDVTLKITLENVEIKPYRVTNVYDKKYILTDINKNHAKHMLRQTLDYDRVNSHSVCYRPY